MPPSTPEFSKEEMRARLDRIRRNMEEDRIDAFISTNPASIRYSSGFKGEPGTLLITHDEVLLFTSFRTLPWAKSQTREVGISTEPDPIGQIAEHLRHQRTAYVGIDPSVTHLAFLKTSERLTDICLRPSRAIERAREIKSEAEIDLIRQSQQHTEAIFNAVLPKIHPGLTERAIQGLILSEIAMNTDLDGYAFVPIVASGPNAWEIHHLPDSTVIRPGDMVIIDLGVSFRGYASDMTRSICLGEPSPRMREIHDIVAEAQVAAIASIRPGVTTCEVDRTARDVITRAGHGRVFTHGLGHSIGLETHDPGLNLSSLAAPATLQAGMVFTVEPGIYLENEFGVRIEDIVVVRENGAEILSDGSNPPRGLS